MKCTIRIESVALPELMIYITNVRENPRVPTSWKINLFHLLLGVQGISQQWSVLALWSL
jgi:hypothetical protein